jgi:hypothetical protein
MLGLPCLLLTISAVFTASNLRHLKTQRRILPFGQGLTQGLIVVPLLGASLLFAAVLWGHAGAPGRTGTPYAKLLLETWRGW